MTVATPGVERPKIKSILEKNSNNILAVTGGRRKRGSVVTPGDSPWHGITFVL
jgi:hypothetical protein